MTALSKNARIAGLIYVFIGVTAPFSLMVVPTKLNAGGRSSVARVLELESMLRWAVVLELAGVIAFTALAFALYRLFADVDRFKATIMSVLILLSVPVSFLNVVHELTAITIAHGDVLTGFTTAQLDGLVTLVLRMYGRGVVVNQVFWGLWLIPFGLLVMQSRFFPRILGILLLVNAAAYPLLTLTSLLAPDYSATMMKVVFPAELGEVWIMLWMLIRGVKS